MAKKLKQLKKDEEQIEIQKLRNKGNAVFVNFDPAYPLEKKYSVVQNTLETDIVKNLRGGGMIAESEFDDMSEAGP